MGCIKCYQNYDDIYMVDNVLSFVVDFVTFITDDSEILLEKICSHAT